MTPPSSIGTPAGDLEAVLTPTDRLAVTPAGELAIEGCVASDLLARFGSPLYVVSEATLRANYRRIRDAVTAAWPAPVTVLYAIKANNTLAIRAILSQEGAGGDCFGEGEIYASLRGGADPAKLVLNGGNKRPADIEQAARLGMTINLDAVDELDLLVGLAARVGRTVPVMLRLKVIDSGMDDLRPDYFGRGGLAEYVRRVKWGFSVEPAAALVRRLSTTEGIDLRGYHFHIGRASGEPDFQRCWASALAAMVLELERRTGFVPRTLDVGGGWPRERDPESRSLARNPTPVETYARAACASLLEGLTPGGIPIPELWLEPGRYIVGNAVTLLATVGAVKRDLGLTWVNVDASTNDLMRIDTSGSAHHILPASGMHRRSTEVATVVGATCTDSVLAIDRCLPPLVRGEPLAILDAGMYAEVASTQLNAVPRPATVLVSGAEAELVKQRETVEDVFARHRIPERLTPRG